MSYVDGFLLPISLKNVPAYQRIARKAGKIWKEYGALAYFEGIGDDLLPKDVAFPFPKAVNLKPGETVVFSYIVYKSRAQRDKIMAKIMTDPRMNSGTEEMPFDMKRMAYGGFKPIVEL